MRTLLTDILPPQGGEPQQMARTFSQSVVLVSDTHLMEVGVVGTVIAAPSDGPLRGAGATLERGVALRTPEADSGV